MTTLAVPLPTRRSTIHLARALRAVLKAGDLVILAGPLGAGKTFLVRAVCRAFGLPERVPVTSPTFTLVQEHETQPPLVHADLYRLDDAEQVRQLGLSAQRDDGKLLFVEWGTPYLEVLGGDAVLLSLQLGPRQAQLSSTGVRSRELLDQLARIRDGGGDVQ